MHFMYKKLSILLKIKMADNQLEWILMVFYFSKIIDEKKT